MSRPTSDGPRETDRHPRLCLAATLVRLTGKSTVAEVHRLRVRIAGVGLTAVLASIVPLEGAAQRCGPHFAGRDEAWIGAFVSQGPEELRFRGSASFNVVDRILLAGAVGGTGYDTGEPGGWSRLFEIGAPMDVASFTICPALASELTSYRFRDRFESSRGEVQELRNSLRLAIHRALPWGGGRLQWQFSPRVVRRGWALAGRTIAFGDTAGLDLDDREEHSWHVDGMVAVGLRLGSFAALTGIESRVDGERFSFPFLGLGYLLKRF